VSRLKDSFNPQLLCILKQLSSEVEKHFSTHKNLALLLIDLFSFLLFLSKLVAGIRIEMNNIVFLHNYKFVMSDGMQEAPRFLLIVEEMI